MHYDKWDPVAIDPDAKDTGCGELKYEFISKSWSEADWDEEWDLMVVPGSDSDVNYMSDGTVAHIIDAEHREEMGDHEVVIRVKSNNMTETTHQDLMFNIKIMDCNLTNFFTPTRELPSIILDVNMVHSYEVEPFIQEPACDFDVVYNVTLE